MLSDSWRVVGGMESSMGSVAGFPAIIARLLRTEPLMIHFQKYDLDTSHRCPSPLASIHLSPSWTAKSALKGSAPRSQNAISTFTTNLFPHLPNTLWCLSHDQRDNETYVSYTCPRCQITWYQKLDINPNLSKKWKIAICSVSLLVSR